MPFTPAELAGFKARIGPLIGLDLEAYKPRQIERRITALLYRASVPGLDALYDQLRADPQRLAAFVDGLTINVSEFLRDGERFAELGERILPALLEHFPRLRIWSAGCSMGAELYSVGMWLERLGALDRCELIGSDLDRSSLTRARAGLYERHEVQGVPADWLEHYFEAQGERFYFRGDAIRARCEFREHNLLADPPIADCQLILCRNVVIYLNETGKRRLYESFAEALAPGGVLFVGKTERIFAYRELGFESVAPYFYRKPGSGKEA